MTDHPITPPPDLVRLWAQEAQRISPHDPVEWMQYVSEKASQWGADQELKACCELLQQKGIPAWSLLRLHRRPKPPITLEEALKLVEFERGPEGWRVKNVKGDVWGSVLGNVEVDVEGTIRDYEWTFVR
jgi:hypothetical protein